MTTYVYLVKCPNCEDEFFDFFDEAKEYALGCLSNKPIITQTEVNRNDFGECTDHCDLGTVWSWEDVMKDTESKADDSCSHVLCKADLEDIESEFDSLDNSVDFEIEEISDEERKPIPEGMTIEQLVEEMEENEDTVECTWCNDLFDKSECRKEVDLGWLCSRCEAAIKSRGETLTFKENDYWDFLDEDTDLNEAQGKSIDPWYSGSFSGLNDISKSRSPEDVAAEAEAKKAEEDRLAAKEADKLRARREAIAKRYIEEGRAAEYNLKYHRDISLRDWCPAIIEETNELTYDPELKNTIAEKAFKERTERNRQQQAQALQKLDGKTKWFGTYIVNGEPHEAITLKGDTPAAASQNLIKLINNKKSAARYTGEEFDWDGTVRITKCKKPDGTEEVFEALQPEAIEDTIKPTSFLEELEDSDTYHNRLELCPECGDEHSYDKETGFCINCGFN